MSSRCRSGSRPSHGSGDTEPRRPAANEAALPRSPSPRFLHRPIESIPSGFERRQDWARVRSWLRDAPADPVAPVRQEHRHHPDGHGSPFGSGEKTIPRYIPPCTTDCWDTQWAQILKFWAWAAAPFSPPPASPGRPGRLRLGVFHVKHLGRSARAPLSLRRPAPMRLAHAPATRPTRAQE